MQEGYKKCSRRGGGFKSIQAAAVTIEINAQKQYPEHPIRTHPDPTVVIHLTPHRESQGLRQNKGKRDATKGCAIATVLVHSASRDMT